MKRFFSIFEAKARLSEIIRIVREQHEVVITDRSKPVVRVVPVENREPRSIQDRLAKLQRSGQIHRPPQARLELTQLSLSKDLLKQFLAERN